MRSPSYGISGVTRGHSYPVAESLWGRRIVAGGAKWLREAPESPNNVTCTFFNAVNLLPKDLRFERGGAKLVSCPWCHLTSLRPCMACERSCSVTMSDRRVMSQYHSLVIISIFSKQFCAPSKWRPWHAPCLPYPRYATAPEFYTMWKEACTSVFEAIHTGTLVILKLTKIFQTCGQGRP